MLHKPHRCKPFRVCVSLSRLKALSRQSSEAGVTRHTSQTQTVGEISGSPRAQGGKTWVRTRSRKRQEGASRSGGGQSLCRFQAGSPWLLEAPCSVGAGLQRSATFCIAGLDSACGTAGRAESWPRPCLSPFGRWSVRQTHVPNGRRAGARGGAVAPGAWCPAGARHPLLPAVGLATHCARGSAPCRRRQRRWAGRLADWWRVAGGAGGRAEAARPAGACAPPAVRSRPRAGAATRVVRKEGAKARAHCPAPPGAGRRCTVSRPGGE
jgi:hypothetical protein